MRPDREIEVLAVRPWEDAVSDAVSFSLQSPYLELVWLGVTGPTAAWMLRRLALPLASRPQGYEVAMTDLAWDLGLGSGTGPSSKVMASLTRLVIFRFAYWSGGTEIQVRRSVPPLPARFLDRVGARARRAHAEAMKSLSQRQREAG